MLENSFLVYHVGGSRKKLAAAAKKTLQGRA